MRREIFTITPEFKRIRLDLAVIRAFPELSRAQLKALKVEASLISGRILKWSYLTKEGDSICLRWEEPKRENLCYLEASNILLDILYEDVECLVINKPAGMVVHPGIGHSTDTLVNALLGHVDGLEEEFRESSFRPRPGLVHRLDKDTSGVVICAKTVRTLEALSKQFRERQTEKYYLAIVKGRLGSFRGIISTSLIRHPRHRQKYTESYDPSNGKQAITHWRVLREWGEASLVMLRPITGRTHQLRVHMLGEGAPILGDMLYSRTATHYSRLFLHAWKLSITLLSNSREEKRTFFAPLPKEFMDFFRTQEPNFKKELWFICLSEGSISP